MVVTVVVALGVVTMGLVLVAFVLVLDGPEGQCVGHVDDVLGVGVGQGGVDGGLESIVRHDQGCVLEGGCLADVEGDVVGLLAGLGQVRHLPGVARHLLGHPGQRIERRDGRATVPGRCVGATPGKEGECSGGGGEDNWADGGQHENHSQAI